MLTSLGGLTCLTIDQVRPAKVQTSYHIDCHLHQGRYRPDKYKGRDIYQRLLAHVHVTPA